MDETDFYHRWLGIPPQEQPISYYRLLGIPLFEDDLEVIANSADRQRSFVKRQSGNVKKFEALGQKILNEIEVARICLMNAEKRQAYNEQLRLRLSEKETPIQATQESNATPPPFFIGSDKNCDLVIDSKSVSSIHCSIVNHASRIILRDLKSTNGTSVNLKRITKPTEVFPSDLILLAKHHRIKLPDTFFTNTKQSSGVAFLGRSDQSEIIIDEATVSSFHARCIFDADDVTIEDLNSTNGSFVVDTLGHRHRLPPFQPTSIAGADGIYLGKHHISIPKLLLDLDRSKANSLKSKGIRNDTTKPS
jgi:pSer/pThr/pTyr-binding forkhead associated (FHA) protein